MNGKPVIFVVTSFILAALIYSSSPTFFPSVEGKPVWGTHIDCKEANFIYETCCWFEDFGTYSAYVCQTCVDRDGYSSTGYEDCGALVKTDTRALEESPTPTPTPPRLPPRLPPGVLGDLPTLEQVPTAPTPPPPFGRNVENVKPNENIEQPLTTTPPLFGRNVPLQGGGVFGQPAITAVTPVPTPPLFGQIAPEGPTLAEGENIQPWNTTFPTPQPFPPPTPGFKAPQTSIDISPDLAPEDDQDETDDNDGGNDIVPDTGIAEQPETQGPEGPSNEEQ